MLSCSFGSQWENAIVESGVVGKGFLIRGWNNPWLYPPAVRQVIITHQNSSHLTKNSPKFRLRAASHGSEYLPIAFNLKRDPNMVSYKPSSDSEITELYSITSINVMVTATQSLEEGEEKRQGASDRHAFQKPKCVNNKSFTREELRLIDR
ncbi:hypothetical protein Peur_001118 [Populus x canadensis]